MRWFVTDHGTVVIAAGRDVETAGFARVQSFSVEACDGDQQCVAVPVTACLRGIHDSSPSYDQYLISWAAVGWGRGRVKNSGE